MVNIMDVSPEALLEEFRGRDSLKAIFELVSRQDHSSPKTIDLDTKVGQLAWKHILFCLTEELYEAANVLKSRPWVSTEYQVDKNHLADELADSIWFFTRLLQLSGYTAEQTFELLVRKFIVNEFRRNTGY